MHRVRWINFDYYSQDEFADLETAMQYVDSKGFEATVEKDGAIVASKGTFSGWKLALTPRTFSELRRGDVVQCKSGKGFRKIKEILRSNRKLTEVEFEDGSGGVFDGLVFTKG